MAAPNLNSDSFVNNTSPLLHQQRQLDMTDFYDEDYDLDTDDDDHNTGESDFDDGDDSGNGES